MSIPIGARLGAYEILGHLGAGGMGEVYRARDGRLGRQVALKMLPPEVTADADRRARLEREARLLALLNHPNVATIHGIEVLGDSPVLVMELVEGETLAERIARTSARGRPMPLPETLSIARQVAAALDAAHEGGIVHRDLKPANIKLGDAGAVKVLDFGIAKAVDDRDSAGVGAKAETAVAGRTQLGAVLGTAPYMSPEQARGLTIDRRTDVWAFGCVLYEMLSGAPPFGADDGADTLSRVLQAEPDLARLPASTPPELRRLLAACFEKERAKRLPHIGTAIYEIDELLSAVPSAPRRRVTALVGVATVLGLSAAAAYVWLRPDAVVVPEPVTRLLLSVAPADEIGDLETGLGNAGTPDSVFREPPSGRPTTIAFALAPDGRSLVFSAVRAEQRSLYLRRFDRDEAEALPGTNGGASPFFSPDGQWVGYWADGEIRRVAIAGGSPVRVASTGLLFGASWGDDDRIVFAKTGGGLWDVPAAGGTPTELVAPAAGEVSFRLPHVLPGADAVLFTVVRARFPRWDETEIFLYSRRAGVAKRLLDGGADARYAASGHVLYVREGSLLAAPFDVKTLSLTGEPNEVLANVMQAAYARGALADTGEAQFAVAANGTLVYLPGGVLRPAQRSISRLDRAGHGERLVADRAFVAPRLSPDGRELVVSTYGRDRDVWLYSLSRGTLTRLPTPGRRVIPIWSPNGEWITYAANASGPDAIYRFRTYGSGAEPELLVSSAANLVPGTWSPDGRELFYYQLPLDSRPGAGSWIWVRNTADGTSAPIPDTTVLAGGAAVSPDGRWLAYHSAESGREEVYVRSYPGPGARQQVSAAGGVSPVWRGDGRELYYLEPQPKTAAGRSVRVLAVPIATSPGLALGAAQTLFEGPYEINHPARSYDVSADGQTFFVVESHVAAPQIVTQMIVVQNWFTELRDRARVSRSRL